MAKKPLYKRIFQVNIELRLKCVMATIKRSGRPRSSNRMHKPPRSSEIATRPDKGAKGL